MREAVATALEMLGLVAVVAGLYFFDWRLAVIALGVCLVLLGLATDRPPRIDR